MDAVLTVRMFGRLEVIAGEKLLSGLHLREAEKLLAYVLLQDGQASATMAAQQIWGGYRNPEDGLRHGLAHLRRQLGDEGRRLQLHSGKLDFDTRGISVDVVTFKAAVRRESVAAWEDAVGLYRAPLLAEWSDDWIRRAREALHEQFLSALRSLASRYAVADRHSEAAKVLREYVHSRPDDEGAQLDLMQALAVCGERVQAIESYNRHRELLHTKHGLQPPPAMTALYHTLREHPAVALPYGDKSIGREESIGGAVPLGSPFYVSRPSDEQLNGAVERRESVILLKGPRQTGKSSMLARGLQHARSLGTTVITTDFEQLSAADMSDLETLCRRLVAQFAASLDLDIPPAKLWSDSLGPGVNLERCMLRLVLDTIAAPVVWALDEADRVFQYPYNVEFFSLLRAWHGKRQFEPSRPWNRLTVVLACATEAHLYIRDLNKSPFNVGTRIELYDFTRQQVEELNELYDCPLELPDEIEQFYRLTGGHPYLVRRGFSELSSGSERLDQMATIAASETGIFSDHLRRIGRFIREDDELRKAVVAVMRREACEPESFFRLRSAGVLSGETEQNAAFRCDIYRQYFERHSLDSFS